MAAENPPERDYGSIEPELTPVAPLAYESPTIDLDDVNMHVEQPMDVPDGAIQINAVIHHPESDRAVRRMFVYWESREMMLHSEIGLVDGTESYMLDREWPEYRPDEQVYDPALEEEFDLKEYVEMVGFDDPVWSITGGFEENMRESLGLHPIAGPASADVLEDELTATIDHDIGVAASDATDVDDPAASD